MGILSRGQQKHIEQRIREYHQMKAAVAEWRDGVIRGSRMPDARTRKTTAADPTASKAIRLANPPKHIREYQAWIDAIDVVRVKLQGSQEDCLFDKWYWAKRVSPDRVTLSLHISRATLFNWRCEVALRVAIQAEKRGVFVA